MKKLYGTVFRQASLTEEENEKVWKNSLFFTESNFADEFQKHLSALDHISECAKIFIMKNWKSIENWRELSLVIVDSTKKSTEYFNYTPTKRSSETGLPETEKKVLDRILNIIEKRDKARHNPIHTIENVVLDPTDGDFSLTINGAKHLWIDNESVILIANYIEKQLKGNS